MVKRKLKEYYGNLPRHIKGPNKNRIDRNATSKLYNLITTGEWVAIAETPNLQSRQFDSDHRCHIY